jgi:SAM-dependent methyltransferase
MSKDATGERRRRRRKGGLRIPSDNVPRRGEESSPERPEPEDPRLAVSVAYAFGADGEPATDDADAASSDPAAQTGEMAAEPMPGGVTDVANAPTLPPPERPAAPAVPAAPTIPDMVAPAGKGPAPYIDTTKTMEMPAVQLEALGLESPGGETGDSVDIAFDEEEPAVDSSRPVRAATQALSDGDIEVLGYDMGGEVAAPEAEQPAEPLVDDTRTTAPLPTIAPPPELADLAEAKPVANTMTGVGGARRASSAGLPAAGPGGPVPRRRSTPHEAPSDGIPRASAQPVSAESAPETLEDEGDRAETVPRDIVDPAAAQQRAESELADRVAGGVEVEIQEEATGELSAEELEELGPDELDTAEPVALLDPSDSGEIITDDLIEEVDEMATEIDAKAAAALSQTQTPPAVPAAKPPSTPPSKPRAAPDAAAKPAQAAKPPPAPKPARPAAEAAPPKPRRRKGKPWFEEIFDEDYLRTLPFLTPQATQAEAEFVHESLALKPGQQVLDVGCGYGRHAMELAARGVHVVALDSSLPLLLRGADEAQRRSLDINFVHGDMRELSFESQFDGAYCLFSTFGYFDDETNKRAAQAIARSLKPGGRLLIEVLNRDYIIGDLPSRVWWEGDGCVVLEEVDFNYFSSRVVSHRSVVFDDSRQLEQEISLRAYSLHEFGKLMHAAGFRVLEISGGMALRGRFFGNQSRDIIVLAEKRAASTE